MKKIIVSIVVIVGAVVALIFLANLPKKETENKSLTIKGSDTEVQLVSNLAEAFSQDNPGINISVTGGGSGVGIASLINKEIDLANSSRQMKQEEKDQATSKQLDVKEFILAIDGLTVIVHPNNGISQLSLDQLSNIYKGEVKNWKDVGGNDKPIVLYGRQDTSGTYIFFRDTILKADYAATMKNMEGSQAIVDAVKTDEGGIGYVGIGYAKDENGQAQSDIKILSLMKEMGGEAVSPLDKAAVQNGSYPISRRIYQYMSGLPAKDSVLEKFLLFQMSDEGQNLIEKGGFYSLTDSDKAQNTSLLSQVK